MGLHPINESTAGKTLITEIVLHRKDTLIVIEVKRNATDARTQVQAQVESLIDELIRNYHPSKTIGAKRRIKEQQELDKLYENYDTKMIQ